jgi:hypothetical protein
MVVRLVVLWNFAQRRSVPDELVQEHFEKNQW